ncbi:MAG: hypothetical protein ABWW65_02180 [Thermoprotei archaeon]
MLSTLNTLYYYPARFNPRIICYLAKHYRGIILDPFAGSGSLLIAAQTNESIGVGWDLNPVLLVYVSAYTSILKYRDVVNEIKRLFDRALGYNSSYIPGEVIYEWYPEKAVNIISKLWGYFHNEIAYYDRNKKSWVSYRTEKPSIWGLYALILLYITRRLSYADDSIAKYYRSRVKREKLSSYLATSDPKSLIKKYIERKLKTITPVQGLCRECREVKARGFIDLTEEEPKRIMELDGFNEVDHIITSPPYLIAHEYIRSTKLDLLWLGLSYSEIEWLSEREIPYKDIEYTIMSGKYDTYREIIRELKTRVLKYYDNYFKALALSFDKLYSIVKPGGKIVIVLGEATLAGKRIPIGEILYEHFMIKHGMRLKNRFEDKIVKRKLFRSRKNANPNGIEYEYVYVFEKPD